MKRAIVLAAFAACCLQSSLQAAETAKPESPASASAKAEQKVGKLAPRAPTAGQLGMSVTGTQEAPKVLYIVPWKTLDAVPAEPYVSGLMDEVFSPIDPVVFERSVHQHEQIQAAAIPAAAEQ